MVYGYLFLQGYNGLWVGFFYQDALVYGKLFLLGYNGLWVINLLE